MKIEIIELMNRINENINYIVSRYPIVNLILKQIDLLLIYDVSDELISNWFKSNESSIRIINEYIENNQKVKIENTTNWRWYWISNFNRKIF